MLFCYRIQGQVYQLINLAAHPDPNDEPSYSHPFFIDSREAVDHRMQHVSNQKCNEQIMQIIDGTLRRVSPHNNSLKMMKEVKNEGNERAEKEGHVPAQIKLLFDIDTENIDKRRYNIPRTNKIAAVFSLKDGEELPPFQGIAIHQFGKELKILNKLDKRTESSLK